MERGRKTHGLSRILREEISRQECACDTRVQLRVAMIHGVDDGVLETTWVCEVEMQLAVLGFVGLRRSGSDVGLERVEADGYDLMGVK